MRAALLSILFASGCVGSEAASTAAARPAAEAAPAAPSERSRAIDEACQVTVDGPERSQPGAPASATISLSAGGRYEVNPDAPLSIEVASNALDLPRTKFTREDASVLAPERVMVEIPFSGDNTGTHELEVHAHFGVCGGDECALCREKRSLSTVIR